MSDAQSWTLLGLVSVLLSVIGSLLVQQIRQVGEKVLLVGSRLDTRIDGLESTFDARLTGLQASVDARFDAVNQRFDAVDRRFDHLDRDVQALIRDRFKRD